LTCHFSSNKLRIPDQSLPVSRRARYRHRYKVVFMYGRIQLHIMRIIKLRVEVKAQSLQYLYPGLTQVHFFQEGWQGRGKGPLAVVPEYVTAACRVVIGVIIREVCMCRSVVMMRGSPWRHSCFGISKSAMCMLRICKIRQQAKERQRHE
jgi:hypothetical protein